MSDYISLGFEDYDFCETYKTLDKKNTVSFAGYMRQFSFCKRLRDFAPKNVDISCGGLKKIPNHIKYLYNFESLELCYNQFSNIKFPKKIRKNIIKISLKHNNFTKIPQSIFSLQNLKIINFIKNNITNIDLIYNLENLEELYLSYNKIQKISENIKNLVNLKKLQISHNLLNEIDGKIGNLTNLQELNFTNNNLISLPQSIGNLTNLQLLQFSSNQIIIIPASFGNLINCEFAYYINPIEYYPPNFQRLIKKKKNLYEVYGDTQNVHNVNIQNCIKQSVLNLLNDKPKNLKIEKILASSLSEKTKCLIVEYINDEEVHSQLNVTFEEVFSRVWYRIRKSEHKKELLKILEDEINAGECKCFTGRISRVVNVLNGFYDDIQINISENEQIGNVIMSVKNSYTGDNLEELKNLIRKELESRNIENILIEEWLKYIEI